MLCKWLIIPQAEVFSCPTVISFSELPWKVLLRYEENDFIKEKTEGMKPSQKEPPEKIL